MAASGRITRRLSRAGPVALNSYAVTLAFTTYFCMYAFRKPFTAATYESMYFLGTRLELKTVFVISQIVGYAVSKFIGIKVCSEATRRWRGIMLALLIVVSELALLLFAVAPIPWKVAAIFFNGLPLGMVWGLVVRYLEGRRTSEILLAGLACSFIVSSGVAKDVGRTLLAGDSVFGLEFLRLPAVSEFWMPAVTGLLFLPPFLLSAWLLNQLPEPTDLDVAARIARVPMNRAQRQKFLQRFFPGIAMLVTAYFLLTAFRDFRDSYLVECLDELGYAYQRNENAISKMELGVTLGVLAVMAAMFFVRDNYRAMLCIFGVMSAGLIIVGSATALWKVGVIDGFWWMLLLGFGSYLTYVPYNTLLFDRLIASTGIAGTAVFAIYVADALGYTGSVAVQVLKDVVMEETSRTEFLARFAAFMSVSGIVLLAGSSIYFLGWRSRPPILLGDSHPKAEISIGIAERT
jgi:hypothetical protein